MKYLFLLALMLFSFPSYGPLCALYRTHPHTTRIVEVTIPLYLYKMVTKENWEQSQNRPFLIVSDTDTNFIRLYEENQVKYIEEREWSRVPSYVVVKLETKQLEGKIEIETNADGTVDCYHLYNGIIPFSAIVDKQTIFKVEDVAVPMYLYKMMTKEDWDRSQNKPSSSLIVSDSTPNFVRLYEENQVKYIEESEWSTVPSYVVVKLDTKQLLGKTEVETDANGGVTRYRLYNGVIPLSAVVDKQIIYK